MQRKQRNIRNIFKHILTLLVMMPILMSSSQSNAGTGILQGLSSILLLNGNQLVANFNQDISDYSQKTMELFNVINSLAAYSQMKSNEFFQGASGSTVETVEGQDVKVPIEFEAVPSWLGDKVARLSKHKTELTKSLLSLESSLHETVFGSHASLIEPEMLAKMQQQLYECLAKNPIAKNNLKAPPSQQAFLKFAAGKKSYDCDAMTSYSNRIIAGTGGTKAIQDKSTGKMMLNELEGYYGLVYVLDQNSENRKIRIYVNGFIVKELPASESISKNGVTAIKAKLVNLTIANSHSEKKLLIISRNQPFSGTLPIIVNQKLLKLHVKDGVIIE